MRQIEHNCYPFNTTYMYIKAEGMSVFDLIDLPFLRKIVLNRRRP